MSEMADAVRAMYRHASAAARVDRHDWTAEQWAEDAKRLMDDIDGSIMSLVNGHVLALLKIVADQPRLIAEAEERGAAKVRERVEAVLDGPSISAFDRKRLRAALDAAVKP